MRTGLRAITPHKSLDHGGALRSVGITGASGYVGSRIAAALGHAGYRVVPLVRAPRANSDDRRYSLERPLDHDLLDGLDVLVHCAWDMRAVSPDDVRRVNIEGSKRLVDAADRAGIRRMIFISTMSAFAGCRSHYGQAKLETEEAVERLRLDTGISDIQGFQAKYEAIARIGAYISSVLSAESGVYGQQVTENNNSFRSKVDKVTASTAVYQAESSNFAEQWGAIHENLNVQTNRGDVETRRYGAEISNYNVSMQGEQIKQSYNRNIFDKGKATADGTLSKDLGIANLQLNESVETLTELSRLNVGMAQAFTQASDVGLGANVGYSSSESLSFDYGAECANQPTCPTVL